MVQTYLLAAVCMCRGAHGTAITFDEKFLVGIKKYSEEKWADVIVNIGEAMEEFEHIEKAWLKCFRQCKEAQTASFTDDLDADDQMRFFHEVLSRRACIKHCQEEEVGPIPWGGVSEYIVDQLKSKNGYNYLQMSFYKEEKFKEAARALSSFAYYSPHDITIKQSMSFYKSMKQLSKEDLLPRETFDYRELFAEGHRMFHTKEWEKMVQTLEDSLVYFYKALDECRTLCDGPLKFEADLEFPRAVSKIWLERLICRVDCVWKLGEFREDRREDFFGVYFHYLQQGYFHTNQSLQALQASAAHVALEPENESAKRNSVFYLRQPGVTQKDFKPRKDVDVEVMKRVADLSLLKLFHKLSNFDDRVEESSDDGLDEILLEEDFQNFPVGVASESPLPLTTENVKPVVAQTFNSGEERMVVDEILTETQCEDLIQLASFGREGDGYNRKSPHTTRETFEGLHILEAAKRAISGEIERNLSVLYVNSSSVSKDVVASQLLLKRPLYFSYTHLVCRTALEEMQEGRDDLSHPVHSDNCILDQETGECDKVPPAYTWRDYSAILYLNDNFEGGDFFFAHSTKDLTPEVRVKPKCGRLVGFSAGKENMHGVTAVTKGKRCAVALWFTTDPDHKEESFDKAADLLQG